MHILTRQAKDAIPTLNALLQRILPLRPLRDCGFTEEDFKKFPQSVEANQQRLMTNAYYLGLGSEARINVPGVAEGNWNWRLLPDQADGALAEEIRAMTQTYGR